MPWKMPLSTASLRATVVDVSRYITAGQSIEEAADEVLQWLREAGLPIPGRR